MAQLMVATETFQTMDEGGAPVSVHAGRDLFFDDDDIVRRFPQFFRVSERHARPEVEAATAAPGEVRGERAAAEADTKVDKPAK